MITPSGRTSISIQPDDFERLKSGASWSSMGGGFQVQVRERSDVPIELVRLRANEAKVSDDGKSTSYASADEPSFGLLLWIEPDEPGH